MNKRVTGYVLVLVGILIILSVPNFTGAVIGLGNVGNIVSVIGLVFVMSGILFILLSNKKLELMVYEDTRRKGKEDVSYTMTDPELYFGGTGLVSLREFRNAMRELGGDPELMGVVREEYGGELKRIASQGTEQERGIALKFLGAMKEEFKIEEEERQNNVGSYSLPTDERREIQTGFKDWEVSPDKRQRELLNRYGIDYVPKEGKKHPHIQSRAYPNIKMTISSTPSDYRATKNLVHDIIHFIEDIRRRDSSR